MDGLTLDRWVPFRNEGAVVRCRLFCFPHAAGNTAFYRPLRRLMPAEVDVCPVELPCNCARPMAGLPSICSFPAAGVPTSLPLIVPRHTCARTTICLPFCAVL